ncbi:restriction endonuclease subunit S [uncultured Bacteroides sp.]|uniref:restriction endonuclease subunit S n=1 Tax=uncultured Bacteroides sp. TaxID=162156 RepID=UPI002AAB5FED|nr:restriction endonuclease subunit S [uncultured Bacteroides sp.]
MEKKTNVPKLRFSEFEGEWVLKKLGEVCEIKTGNKDTQNKVDDGIYPFFVRSDIVERINSYSYDGEAILTSGDGVGVGKNFHYINGKFDFHQRVYCLRNFKNDYCGRFIYYVFSDKFYGRVIRLSAKNSVDSVRMDMISDMNIYFSIISEQTKIASFLTAVDDKLTQLKKKKSLLEEYKKGVMQKIFSQELRFKDDNGEDFPEWKEKNGNLIFESVSDKKHNSDLPILAITQEYGAIPRDLIDYNISVTDKSVESYKVVQKGDFIISLRSFQGGIEYSNYKGICSPAYIILRPIVKIDDRFYKFFFKTDSYIKSLNKNLEGIRDGKMISFKYFSEIYLPVPSLPEQTKIANFLSAIDEKINHCSKQIERMEDWKKGLLQQMFV